MAWPARRPQVHPDGVLAANVRACLEFREHGPEAARASLRGAAGLAAEAQRSALLSHNLVVFGDGAGGMQVGGAGRPRQGRLAGGRAAWQPRCATTSAACCRAVCQYRCLGPGQLLAASQHQPPPHPVPARIPPRQACAPALGPAAT